MKNGTDNRSTTDKLEPIPSEIHGWNWGALFLNWIWGIGNNVWVALLCFVPCFGVFMPFVLLVKGNEWAWRKGRWDSVEHFKRVQRVWAIAGIAFVSSMIVLLALFVGAMMAFMKSTDAYQGALALVRLSPQAIEVLGEPIEDGFFVSGNIEVSDGSGSAEFSFPVKGPAGSGRVYVLAVLEANNWEYTSVTLMLQKPTERSIDLVP